MDEEPSDSEESQAFRVSQSHSVFFGAAADEPPSPFEVDDEETEHEQPAWIGPPTNVLGVPLTDPPLVIRSRYAVVALTRVVAYPSGVVFELDTAGRRSDLDRDRWVGVQEAMWGRAPFGARRSDLCLRAGIALADGTRVEATELDHHGWQRDADGQEPATPRLRHIGGGGGGGGSRFTQSESLWLWPLPEGESLDLVVLWEALQIPETRLRIDAAAIREAAARAEPYWPDSAAID